MQTHNGNVSGAVVTPPNSYFFVQTCSTHVTFIPVLYCSQKRAASFMCHHARSKDHTPVFSMSCWHSISRFLPHASLLNKVSPFYIPRAQSTIYTTCCVPVAWCCARIHVTSPRGAELEISTQGVKKTMPFPLLEV